MKIYPGRHKVMAVKQVDNNIDIPLAYIDVDYKDYSVNIIPKFSTDKKDVVIPYSEYDSIDVCFFDENRNLIDNTNIMQRDKDKYYYVPVNAVSFNPQRFNYSVVGKKKIEYRTDIQYDLKVACIDNESMDLSRHLIKVFGDAPDRQICPANITVNNKDISFYSLINSGVQENDFIFIRSNDGVNYKDTSTAIDYDLFLNEHTNVWVSVENFPYQLIPTANKTDIGLKKPILYSNPPMMNYVFDTTELPQDSNVVYHNIFKNTFAGVLIKEVPNKGFIIMTPAEFMVNIESNSKLLYEIMMYVYLKSYIESATINDWITDVIPDYVVMNNKLTKKTSFSSNVEFYRLLGFSQAEVDLIDVKISPENVRFAGIQNDFIIFRKEYTGVNQKYADPQKPTSDTISVFTPRQNVVYYKNFIYNIEDAVQDKILWTINGDYLAVKIKPIVNTLNKINITQESSLNFRLFKVINYKEQKITNAILYLICKENILSLIDSETYVNTDGIIIAELHISQSENPSKIYDMRQRGGGYPLDITPPTQCLLDVGNIYGMAYRKTGTLIITLPKRLEQYEELITKAVKRHMVAEELPIILFEDKEE